MIPTMTTMLMAGVSVHAEEFANDVIIPPNHVALDNPSDARTQMQIYYALMAGQATITFLNNKQAPDKMVSEEVFNGFVEPLLQNWTDPIIQNIRYKSTEQCFVITMHTGSFVEQTLRDKKLPYRFVKNKWVPDRCNFNASDVVNVSYVGSIKPPGDIELEECLRLIEESVPNINIDFSKLYFSKLEVEGCLRHIEESVADIDISKYCMGKITDHCDRIGKDDNYQGIGASSWGYKLGRKETWPDKRWCPAWLDFVGTPTTLK